MVTSSLVPVAAQYAPREDRRRDELMRKSNGIDEAVGSVARGRTRESQRPFTAIIRKGSEVAQKRIRK